MDEQAIEQSLIDYKQQLAQIDNLLCHSDEENKVELMHLQKDILDLIKVTEESLISLKKSRLLQELANADSGNEKVTDDRIHAENSNKAGTSQSSSWQDQNEPADQDGSSNFLGIKCKVRYTHEWGLTEYHNAMVLGPEENEDGDQKVKVLFMNPTHMSMLPCPFFLDGKCNFDEDSCRYSHGHLADIECLEEYVEPDFSKLKPGEQCLAKYENGVWYKSTIREVKDDTVEIHYDTYDTDAVLNIHDVLPLEMNNYASDSSSTSDVDDENSREFSEDNYVAKMSVTPLRSIGPLGEWEMYTRGIGSKLMAKMGYINGKGLGRDGEGRVEPIEIVILPAGKSLDKVAELREKGKLHKPTKRRKSKHKMRSGDASGDVSGGVPSSSKKGTDVFEFINKKLKPKEADSTEVYDIHEQRVRHNVEESYQQLKKIRLKKKKGETSHKQNKNGLNWNLQLFKNNERTMALKKQIQKQKEALKRNMGRDQEMVNRLTSSIKALESELSELEKSGKTIENKIHSKAQHKKLTVF